MADCTPEANRSHEHKNFIRALKARSFVSIFISSTRRSAYYKLLASHVILVDMNMESVGQLSFFVSGLPHCNHECFALFLFSTWQNHNISIWEKEPCWVAAEAKSWTNAWVGGFMNGYIYAPYSYTYLSTLDDYGVHI